jgi:hypothetical protein
MAWQLRILHRGLAGKLLKNNLFDKIYRKKGAPNENNVGVPAYRQAGNLLNP